MRTGWLNLWYSLSSRLRVLQLVNRVQLRSQQGELEATLEERGARMADGADAVGQVDWPGRRRVSLEEFEAALVELAHDVRADGARLILGSMPRSPENEQRCPVLSLYSQRLMDVARREGLQLLDLRAIVIDETRQGRPWQEFFVEWDGWHLSPAGHALFAERLSALVLDPSLGR